MDAATCNMAALARIRGATGAFIVPVDTPYDHELLFDAVEESARRHGTVRLEINRRAWKVTLANDVAPDCSTCQGAAATLIYTAGGRCLCAGCARRLATTISPWRSTPRKAGKRKDIRASDPQARRGSSRTPRPHRE